MVVACSVGVMGASPTALKPFDPVAFQGAVEATAKGGRHGSVRTPQGDFAFGYGATKLGGTSPPRGDTHFRIASNTKTMTTAVIVLLAQEGKLRFDDPVSKYVSGVPNGDNITISELLKMRSGLYNYTSAPELAESLDRDPTRASTPEELLVIAFKRPPLFAPGTAYDYCNTNYVLLGLIIDMPWWMRRIPPIFDAIGCTTTVRLLRIAATSNGRLVDINGGISCRSIT
jgi:D-alanyl-D-alanine carboxypeptidase